MQFPGIVPGKIAWASITSAPNCVMKTRELSSSDHLMGLGVTFIVLNVGHCPLVIPKGELIHLSCGMVVQYQDRRLRTAMSLAQLALCRCGKMRGRSEATANLFCNLPKNPTSPTVAGYATKTKVSPNLLKALSNICLTLMLQRLLKVPMCSRVSFLK